MKPQKKDSQNPPQKTDLRDPKNPALFTIGHSTRSLEQLLAILKTYEIQLLVDIRTIPRSRRNPQFNRDTLGAFLRAKKIGYRHMKALGGLRRPRPDSINIGFRNASFRGYADYMQSPEFEAAIQKLMALGKKKRTAVMCAEAVPWRCHRSLVADVVAVRGWSVVHLFSPVSSRPHVVTRFARVSGHSVSYPASDLVPKTKRARILSNPRPSKPSCDLPA